MHLQQLSMVITLVSTVVWDVCQTVVCAHVAWVCRTAEIVRGTSQATVSTTPTCARYDSCLVVDFSVLGTTHKHSYLIPTTVYSFQACIRKRRRPRFTRAIYNIVNEVQLPASGEDTSFHHFLHRNAEEIDRIVNEHVERYGYISCSSDFLFFPFFSFCLYGQTKIAVVFCLCLTGLYVS